VKTDEFANPSIGAREHLALNLERAALPLEGQLQHLLEGYVLALHRAIQYRALTDGLLVVNSVQGEYI
jgi:hypothetical protein